MNFYFIISKTRDREDPLAKIAMNIDAEGEKEYWNAHDNKIKEPAGLPEFKPEHATEVVIINGKKITIEQLSKMENLEIKGDLDLGGTQIKELPQGLKVGGYLNLYGTPIKELPQGLTVGGDLYLRYTQIKELPQGLTVGGGLDLIGTQIKELPQGLKVKKAIYVDDKSKIKCSDELRKKLR